VKRDNYIIGVDIGGTHVRIGGVDDDNHVHSFIKEDRRNKLQDEHFPYQLLHFLQEYISEYARNWNILGLVIGFPSTLSINRRTILSSPNIAGLDNLDMADYLERDIGIPVLLERDVNLLLCHDIYIYGAQGVVIGCYVGTGLGNAISIDGHILSGKDGVAGELGHIPVLGKDDLCGCGNRGCIENYASGRYLVYLVEENFPDTVLVDIFIRYPENPQILKFIDNIAVAIATEVNILNPDYIILGGGVLDMAGFPKEYLEKCICEHSRKPLPANTLRIQYSLSSDNNGVLGAAIYGRRKLKETEV